MKRIISCVLTSVLIGVWGMNASPTSVADVPPSVAIIDSGINTALFSNSIVDEVCILEYSPCPNGKSFMDGTGAANTGLQTSMTLIHGNEMASISIATYSANEPKPVKPG